MPNNTPTSISGALDKSIYSIHSAVVDLAASTANQVMVAAPAATLQIYVLGMFLMADTADGTITFQDEDDTALSGVMPINDANGFVLPVCPNLAVPWMKVAAGKALEADTGACTVDGIIVYALVAV